MSFQASSRIILTGGAKLSNVYFQVDGAVHLYPSSVFKGILVAQGAIQLLGDSKVYGKVLSSAGAIALHNNIVFSVEETRSTILGNKVGPLPISLYDFVANKNQNNTVALSWSTAKEFNSDRFEIEKSLTGIDWQTIGTVQAAGESKKMKHYSYSNEYVDEGLNFYRLKMIDQDNTFTYSRIRTVSYAVEHRTVMYPNPARDRLTLDVDDMAMVDQIQLRDISGKIVYDQSKNGFLNLTNSIDINHFSAGIYGVQITRTNGNVTFLKILKQ